jgi:hypothetical protein
VTLAQIILFFKNAHIFKNNLLKEFFFSPEKNQEYFAIF